MAGSQDNRYPGNSAEENMLYSVGELCDLVGTTRKTLFYYDRIGLLTPTKREGVQNFKQYDNSKIVRLRKIIEYRDAGLRIAEIRELLDDENADPLEVMHAALTRMLKEKDSMENTIRNLQELIRREEKQSWEELSADSIHCS